MQTYISILLNIILILKRVRLSRTICRYKIHEHIHACVYYNVSDALVSYFRLKLGFSIKKTSKGKCFKC